MNDENLIHLKGKGDRHSDEIRAMTKGVCTQKAKDSQRTRRFRETLQKHPEKIPILNLEMLNSSKAMADRMVLLLQSVESKELTPELELKLHGQVAKLFELWYGSKSKNINANLNINAEPYHMTIVKPYSDEKAVKFMREVDELRSRLGEEPKYKKEIEETEEYLEEDASKYQQTTQPPTTYEEQQESDR